MQESYVPVSRETTPSFLIARVTPALSRSCRLALDLPVLGILTWLCAGARRPRRGIPTTDLWRRLRQVFPELRATPRQEGAALTRLWRAGLVTVDENQRWRPCWHKQAMVCRLDVALWRRQDLSPAAKRVHAVAGHRIARGHSDAARWLGQQTGMGRGRIGAALRELQRTEVIVYAGQFSSTRVRRSWPAWTTGTQVKGVILTPSPGRQSAGAASPKTQAVPGKSAADPAGTVPLWRERLRRADFGPVDAAFLAQALVAVPGRALTRAGLDGLNRLREDLARRLQLARVHCGIVAAWLLEHEARGLTPLAAGAALVTAIRMGDLTAFVKRTGAERHLASGRRAREVEQLVDTNWWPDGRHLDTSSGLRVGSAWDTSGSRMALHRLLRRLDATWSRATPLEQDRSRAEYQRARYLLTEQLAQLDCPTQPPQSLLACRRSANTCARIAGSP